MVNILIYFACILSTYEHNNCAPLVPTGEQSVGVRMEPITVVYFDPSPSLHGTVDSISGSSVASPTCQQVPLFPDVFKYFSRFHSLQKLCFISYNYAVATKFDIN